MSKFPFEEIDLESVQKDFFSALLSWIVLSIFCFVLLPKFSLIKAGNKQLAWFIASIPPGVTGAILVGVCSEFIRLCQEHYHGRNRKPLIWLGTLVGWLGLAGTIYPLVIIGLQFWLQLLSY